MMNTLQKIYLAYCTRERLPVCSADEHVGLTPDQTRWMRRFIHVWDRGTAIAGEMYLPAPVRREIKMARDDIDFIHWDQCVYEHATDEWVIPCEAKIEGSWMHGHMHVEKLSDGTFDYSVGDWDDGMHPDLHTFER